MPSTPNPKIKKVLVTGGAGFIGSHVVDQLIEQGYLVTVLDNLLSGFKENLNPAAEFVYGDIQDRSLLNLLSMESDALIHLAAIGRTPWCIENPILAYETNVMGTLKVLEAARQKGLQRAVLASSNVVYAAHTPYRATKEAGEGLGRVYGELYGLSVISLRFSNVYGKRQSELGISPNVFAALRKSKKELGRLQLTGDGSQTRDYTHVTDIARGIIMAMQYSPTGAGDHAVLDLCTGVNTSLNEVAKYFDCPVEYVPERKGDVKHIVQDPRPASALLGWEATIPLSEGIKDVLC